MTDTITIDELIEELRPLVEYRADERKHYMGATILTNKEMDAIMRATLGDAYASKTANQRTKMRQRAFKECM